MRPGLAARLSRFLVRCYPPRWRQRYAEELLEVLDQHQPTSRTVLNLWAGAVSATVAVRPAGQDAAWRRDGFMTGTLTRCPDTTWTGTAVPAGTAGTLTPGTALKPTR